MDFIFAQHSVICSYKIILAFMVVLIQRPSDSHTVKLKSIAQ